jgi:hypothetical protein
MPPTMTVPVRGADYFRIATVRKLISSVNTKAGLSGLMRTELLPPSH